MLGRNKSRELQAPAGPRLGLPTNKEILDAAGVTCHFYVDSVEGPHMELDAEVIRARADAARERLLGRSAAASLLDSSTT